MLQGQMAAEMLMEPSPAWWRTSFVAGQRECHKRIGTTEAKERHQTTNNMYSEQLDAFWQCLEMSFHFAFCHKDQTCLIQRIRQSGVRRHGTTRACSWALHNSRETYAFSSHINMVTIKKVVVRNLHAGRFVKGASTSPQ